MKLVTIFLFGLSIYSTKQESKNYFRVGDIYECNIDGNSFGIIITYREGKYLKFAALQNYKSNMSKEELMSIAAISYHKRNRSVREKILSSVLGGEVPYGYYSCFAEKKLLKSMAEQLILKHSITTLTSGQLVETGGTSLSSLEELGSTLQRCLNFKLDEYKEVQLNEIKEMSKM